LRCPRTPAASCTPTVCPDASRSAITIKVLKGNKVIFRYYPLTRRGQIWPVWSRANKEGL
jgi:hypothetical protein